MWVIDINYILKKDQFMKKSEDICTFNWQRKKLIKIKILFQKFAVICLLKSFDWKF